MKLKIRIIEIRRAVNINEKENFCDFQYIQHKIFEI